MTRGLQRIQRCQRARMRIADTLRAMPSKVGATRAQMPTITQSLPWIGATLTRTVRELPSGSAERLGEGLLTTLPVTVTQPKASGTEHVAPTDRSLTPTAIFTKQASATGLTTGTTTVRLSRRWRLAR